MLVSFPCALFLNFELFKLKRNLLRAERQPLCVLHHLLVYASFLGSHNYLTQLRINLGAFYPIISNQINDPSLSLLFAHVKLLGQYLDADALMNAAEHFEYEESGALAEII